MSKEKNKIILSKQSITYFKRIWILRSENQQKTNKKILIAKMN